MATCRENRPATGESSAPARAGAPQRPPRELSEQVLALQRTVGNRDVGRVLARSGDPPAKRASWWGSWPPKLPYAELLDALETNFLEGLEGQARAQKTILKRKRDVIRYWKARIAEGDKLVKIVESPAKFPQGARGYIVLDRAIRGKTVSEIEDVLGFDRNYLGPRMEVQELKRLPRPDEFELRGHNALHPGTDPMRPANVKNPRFTKGAGVGQWELTSTVPVTSIAAVDRPDRYAPTPASIGWKPPPRGTSPPARGGTTLNKPRKLALPWQVKGSAKARAVRATVGSTGAGKASGTQAAAAGLLWEQQMQWTNRDLIQQRHADNEKRIAEQWEAVVEHAKLEYFHDARFVRALRQALVPDDVIYVNLKVRLKFVELYDDLPPYFESLKVESIGLGEWFRQSWKELPQGWTSDTIVECEASEALPPPNEYDFAGQTNARRVTSVPSEDPVRR